MKNDRFRLTLRVVGIVDSRQPADVKAITRELRHSVAVKFDNKDCPLAPQGRVSDINQTINNA